MQRITELIALQLQLKGPAPVIAQQLVTLQDGSGVLEQRALELPMVAADFNDELLSVLNQRLSGLGLVLQRKDEVNQ